MADGRLWERQIDQAAQWLDSEQALTDNTIQAPENPALGCTADAGMLVYFDAVTPMVAQNELLPYRRDLFRVALDSSAVERLTADPAVRLEQGKPCSADFAPTVSPQGSRLAFGTTRPGSHGEIALADSDTGLGSGYGELLARGEDCAWHPERDLLICAETTLHYTHPHHWLSSGLFLLDPVDGTTTALLSDVVNAIRDPSWSPGGTRVAYSLEANVAGPSGEPAGLYIMDIDDGHTALVAADAAHPTWISDTLLVVHRPDGDGELDLFALALEGGDAGELTRLTPKDGRSVAQPLYAHCGAGPALGQNAP